MKHLRIEYTTDGGNTITLFDDEVAEVTWSDSPGGVRVEGKTQAGGGLNLLEMLTGGSKARTDALAEEKRAEYEAEKEAASKPAAKAVAKPKAAPKPRPEPIVVEVDDDAESVDLADAIDDTI